MNPLWRNILSVPCPFPSCLAAVGERCVGIPRCDGKEWSSYAPFHRLRFEARPLAEDRIVTGRRYWEKKRAGESAAEREARLKKSAEQQRRKRRENYTGRAA